MPNTDHGCRKIESKERNLGGDRKGRIWDFLEGGADFQ